MAEQRPNTLKILVLEMGPLTVFFLAFTFAPHGRGVGEAERQLAQILFATAVFMPLTMLSFLYSWYSLHRVPKLALLTTIIVLVFGSLTLGFKDPKFIKLKPTIVYLVFAWVIGLGLWRGKHYLTEIFGGLVQMNDRGRAIFSKRFVLFFLIGAALNEFVWRNFSTDIWVIFKTFYLPVTTVLFVWNHQAFFKKHRLV